MKINNLNHIEAATQEIVGGRGHGYYKPIYVNVANAFAGANAFGSNTLTLTSTSAFVVSGVLSASGSYSGAIAVG